MLRGGRPRRDSTPALGDAATWGWTHAFRALGVHAPRRCRPWPASPSSPVAFRHRRRLAGERAARVLAAAGGRPPASRLRALAGRGAPTRSPSPPAHRAGSPFPRLLHELAPALTCCGGAFGVRSGGGHALHDRLLRHRPGRLAVGGCGRRNPGPDMLLAGGGLALIGFSRSVPRSRHRSIDARTGWILVHPARRPSRGRGPRRPRGPVTADLASDIRRRRARRARRPGPSCGGPIAGAFLAPAGLAVGRRGTCRDCSCGRAEATHILGRDLIAARGSRSGASPPPGRLVAAARVDDHRRKPPPAVAPPSLAVTVVEPEPDDRQQPARLAGGGRGVSAPRKRRG